EDAKAEARKAPRDDREAALAELKKTEAATGRARSSAADAEKQKSLANQAAVARSLDQSAYTPPVAPPTTLTPPLQSTGAIGDTLGLPPVTMPPAQLQAQQGQGQVPPGQGWLQGAKDFAGAAASAAWEVIKSPFSAPDLSADALRKLGPGDST